MGCYVGKDGVQHDACVLDVGYLLLLVFMQLYYIFFQTHFNSPDSYYLFNHVDIKIQYRDMSQDPNILDDKVGLLSTTVYLFRYFRLAAVSLLL